jgi:hypothetical protein
MNDDNELTDSAVLSAVRDSISGLPMPTAPRLEAITARGRARRRRRLAGVSIAVTGACAALVVGLAGGGGSGGPVRQLQHLASPVHVSQVHLAAFTVVAGPDGGTTLILSRPQVANPSAVRQALAERGIPALVTANEFCRTADQPAPGVGDVVTLGSPQAGVVIYGSRIPSGVELSIGYRQDPQDSEISFSLIQAGAPLTCTSIPDHGPHGND